METFILFYFYYRLQTLQKIEKKILKKEKEKKKEDRKEMNFKSIFGDGLIEKK